MKTLSIEDIKQTEIINSQSEAVKQFEVIFKSEDKTVILEGSGSLKSLSPVH